MAFNPVNEVVAVRQTSSAAFTGVVCRIVTGNVVFEPFCNPTTKVVEYLNPADLEVNTATAGGEFVFPETVVIREIRSDCGNVTLAICDTDNSHSVAITTSPSPIVTHSFMNNITVQKSQKLKITSSADGWVEVYVVKATGV